MFKYTSDDTIFSGMNLYPHFSTIRRGITDLVRFDKSVFQLDSIRYSLKIFFSQYTIQKNMIYLFVIVFRMGQFLSQIAVIRKQQHSCRLPVQTPYRIDSFFTSTFDQGHNRLTFQRILDGCHIIFRFI